MESSSIKFVQMMTLDRPLTFLGQGQISVSTHFYGENIDKSFSQNL